MAGRPKTVEEQVLDALTKVRYDLHKEKRDRRRALFMQALGLAIAGLITTGIAAKIVHDYSCRTTTKANRTTLFVLNALLDGGERRDYILPPQEREEARIRREEARRIGRDLLYPDACH